MVCCYYNVLVSDNRRTRNVEKGSTVSKSSYCFCNWLCIINGLYLNSYIWIEHVLEVPVVSDGINRRASVVIYLVWYDYFIAKLNKICLVWPVNYSSFKNKLAEIISSWNFISYPYKVWSMLVKTFLSKWPRFQNVLWHECYIHVCTDEEIINFLLAFTKQLLFSRWRMKALWK